jgi:hypothetical protein
MVKNPSRKCKSVLWSGKFSEVLEMCTESGYLKFRTANNPGRSNTFKVISTLLRTLTGETNQTKSAG